MFRWVDAIDMGMEVINQGGGREGPPHNQEYGGGGWDWHECQIGGNTFVGRKSGAVFIYGPYMI